ncbi:endonuclease-reverse transcriptase domain-containing protein [Phthorimaea operculella]|nr:endonuclease-reverse transcriptase domain-containing protein [Phthorimaea operculella]
MYKNQIDAMQVEGYKLASWFCRTNFTRGGSCIYLKEGIEYIEKKEFVELSVEYIIEISAIEIPQINLVLVCLYWPDSKRKPDTFFKTLSQLLNILKTKYAQKKVILGGDLNVNTLLNTPLSRKLIELMKSFNFHQHIKEPTHIIRTLSSCIDHIYTNFQNRNMSAKVIEYGFSDHKGLLLKMPAQIIKTRDVWYINKRQFNDKNMQHFKKLLTEINWSNIIDINKNVDQNYTSFSTAIHEILNKSVPITKIKLRKKSKKYWLTPGIKKSCKHKRLLKSFISHNHNNILIDHYKKYEKFLKLTVKISKKNENIKRMKNSKNSIITMWRIVKEKTNKIIQKEKSNIKLRINNRNIDDPHLVANEFNDFFVSVGATKNKDTFSPMTPSQPVAEDQDARHSVLNSMYLRLVDEKEVLNIIKRLKNKKSFGYDEIPPILVKFCAQELAPVL